MMQCGRYQLPMFGAAYRPRVMGILNVTPDSFSDAAYYDSLTSALFRAERMIEEGVDIIDIGGESSRPGAQPVSSQEELARVIPVIRALRTCGVPLSIDTYKPEVMRAAIDAGVDMINDIRAFREPGAVQAVMESDCALCVMHMQYEPRTMQIEPAYNDVVQDVTLFLQERVSAMELLGIRRDRLCIDPGFGFGKKLEHNVSLLQNLRVLVQQICVPILVGVSRKSMIGLITGKSVNQRLAGSLAGALIAVKNGACIVRVHDVSETVDALKMWQAVIK